MMNQHRRAVNGFMGLSFIRVCVPPVRAASVYEPISSEATYLKVVALETGPELPAIPVAVNAGKVYCSVGVMASFSHPSMENVRMIGDDCIGWKLASNRTSSCIALRREPLCHAAG